MKRFSHFMVYAAAVAFAAAAVSCSRSSKADDQPYTLEADSAVAYFIQTDDNTAYDMAQLSLVCGDLIENNGSYSGQGTALLLDMNISKGAEYILGGTYQCKDGIEDFLFMPGSYSSEKQEFFPSYVYERNEDMRTGEYYLVRSGKAVIKRSGSNYSVDASVVTNNGTYRFSYYGKFVNGGSSDNPGGGDTGDDDDPAVGDFPDIDLSSLVQGIAQYYGSEVWNDANGNLINSDYSDWMIYLGEQGADLTDVNSSMLQLDVLAKKTDVTSMSSGTYTVVEAVTAATCVPFNSVAGYIDEEGYYQGGYYFDEENGRYYRITDGTVTITKGTGDDYTFKLSLGASDNGAKVTGSFTASLTYVDASKGTEDNDSTKGSGSVVSTMRRLSSKMPYSRRAGTDKTLRRSGAGESAKLCGTERNFSPRH